MRATLPADCFVTVMIYSPPPRPPSTLTAPCEQLLLSRVFVPNTVTPGPFPEQMKMDTLNLIPDEISPRLARGPVFKSQWRPHTLGSLQTSGSGEQDGE